MLFLLKITFFSGQRDRDLHDHDQRGPHDLGQIQGWQPSAPQAGIGTIWNTYILLKNRISG